MGLPRGNIYCLGQSTGWTEKEVGACWTAQTGAARRQRQGLEEEVESHGPGKEASRRTRRRKQARRKRWSATVLWKSPPQPSGSLVLRKPRSRIRQKQGLKGEVERHGPQKASSQEASGSLALRRRLEVSSSGTSLQEASGSLVLRKPRLGSLWKSRPRKPQTQAASGRLRLGSLDPPGRQNPGLRRLGGAG